VVGGTISSIVKGISTVTNIAEKIRDLPSTVKNFLMNGVGTVNNYISNKWTSIK
jgi:hypothetical protein